MATISAAFAAAVHQQQAGDLPAAEAVCRQILAVQPQHGDAWHLLGVLLHQAGRHAEAAACIQRAIAANGTHAAWFSNLAAVHLALQQTPEAIACCQQAIARNPRLVEAHIVLGNALLAHGRSDEAAACYRHALQLQPEHAAALNNLGNLLQRQGDLAAAIDCYHRAARVQPAYADAHYNLAHALHDQGALEAALAAGRRALELQPDFAEAWHSLGGTYQAQGRLDEADDCYARALQLQPDYAAAHSNLLMSMHYRFGVTPAELAAAHARFDQTHARRYRSHWPQPRRALPSGGRLRLGFVSPDFGRHPVGYFLIRALQHLDRGCWECVCYSDRIRHDDLTARFQAAATGWRDVKGLNDDQLAEQIRADGVDILFDLAGHTADNRLLVFARKPAPLQITWLGYEGTTGLEAIDYLLADGHTLPAEHAAWCCERVLRMPDSAVCYDPPAAAPQPGPLPAAKNGGVCFGSFSNPAKLNVQVAEVWAQILRRVPHARLLLKYRGLDDPGTQARVAGLFTARGIAASRLEFAPWSPRAAYLAAFQQVDLALDPFPFQGGITTCDALWMGVPVITCPGATFASRHALSYLSSVGWTETIARDFDDYVALAVDLADDLPRLAELRAGLRERVAASPLCDGPRFARNLTALLHTACATYDPGAKDPRPA